MLEYSNDVLNARLNQILVPVKVADVLEDGGFRYLAVNRALSEAAGRPATEYLGREITEVYAEPEFRVMTARFALVRDTAEPISYEEELALPKGRSWWRSTVSPVKDHKGVVRQLCVTCLPIDREIRLRPNAPEPTPEGVKTHATVTHAISDLDQSLNSILKMGEALLLPGSQLAPDERRLVDLIMRLAKAADTSLAHIRQGGREAMHDVVEQALLTQGPLADLVKEVETEAKTR